jgi:hypothetical protein
MRSGANECSACRRAVTFALLGGKVVAVEKCPQGRGDVALTGDLFRGGDPLSAPLANVVTMGTGYRLHVGRCPGLRSFTKPFRRSVVR